MECSWCQIFFSREVTIIELLAPWRIPEKELCPQCAQRFTVIDWQSSAQHVAKRIPFPAVTVSFGRKPVP